MILTPNDLQPGDVRVTIADPALPVAIIHGAIATITRHWAVHSTIVESAAVEIHPGASVVRRPRSEWDRFALVLRHPNNVIGHLAAKAAVEMLGAPYDLLGMITGGVEAVTGADLPDTQGPGAICSRFVVRAFAAAGDAAVVPGVKESDVLPWHLVEASRLLVLGYMRTN